MKWTLSWGRVRYLNPWSEEQISLCPCGHFYWISHFKHDSINHLQSADFLFSRLPRSRPTYVKLSYSNEKTLHFLKKKNVTHENVSRHLNVPSLMTYNDLVIRENYSLFYYYYYYIYYILFYNTRHYIFTYIHIYLSKIPLFHHKHILYDIYFLHYFWSNKCSICEKRLQKQILTTSNFQIVVYMYGFIHHFRIRMKHAIVKRVFFYAAQT